MDDDNCSIFIRGQLRKWLVTIDPVKKLAYPVYSLNDHIILTVSHYRFIL